MNDTIKINQSFELAANYVNTTGEHLYLTGKAGTGKTTFLRYIRQHCPKKMVVAAPTGVAAINAGGVTLHSLFQLPLGNFIPAENAPEDWQGEFFDKKNLLRKLRLNRAKRDLLRELELLVIDEVSMLRADLLDAIDVILRSVRRRSTPFGGVQILFIGDLFQLPPVMRDRQWAVLGKFYKGISFFYARALQDSPPVYLELKTIYRQSDEKFIDLLNKIRNNQMDRDDLEFLNQYHKPNFDPRQEEGEYIMLTTHNRRADAINDEQLAKLPEKVYSFKAEIWGNFDAGTIIAETDLRLKKGAQVMFIRNDKGEKPRYYNGKIGTVMQVDQKDIVVNFADSDQEVRVEKEVWENKRYKLNKETDELEEELKGTFTQYPIRLAWAITIHKSQGLTFERAIVDAGHSFSAGQVYVALSRLRSLDGLVLYSPISDSCITSDRAAIDFSKSEQSVADLKDHLGTSQVAYIRHFLLKAFDWGQLRWEVVNFRQNLETGSVPDKPKTTEMILKLQTSVLKQEEVAGKFIRQLSGLLPHALDDDYKQVHDRVKAASDYFAKALAEEILDILQAHYDALKVRSGVKTYLREVYNIIAPAKQKQFMLSEIVLLTEGLTQGRKLPDLLAEMANRKKDRKQKAEAEYKKTGKKTAKGESHRTSLEMYKSGKSIDEIAKERELKPSTIEGHLISFIGTEFDLNEFITPDKVEKIKAAIEKVGDGEGSTPIKTALGEDFSYHEIRAVLKDMKS